MGDERSGLRHALRVTILVDEAIWPWRGGRWAHLATDLELGELHGFANRLGVPRLAFQGDHYDVPADLRRRAIEFGARAVSGRDLVEALRQSGLRRRGGLPPWEQVGEVEASRDPVIATVLDALDGAGALSRTIYARANEYGLWVPTSSAIGTDVLTVTEIWRSTVNDRVGYELIVARPEP